MLNKYNDVLTVEELCEVLRIGKNTAYRLLKSNEIKSVKIGKIYKIPKKSVRKYLEKNT
ncbi:MAG: helix-turn-helix domain-containing protein [Ruminococcaceae bacterium]|nr:helix-turn-helix domain-containing protein [Oscillospiraceae bacterium]